MLLFFHLSFVDLFFFFKQKTAYDMRISDWSSDVCSSDLHWRRIWPRRSGYGIDDECVGVSVRFRQRVRQRGIARRLARWAELAAALPVRAVCRAIVGHRVHRAACEQPAQLAVPDPAGGGDRKSTRLNSSH